MARFVLDIRRVAGLFNGMPSLKEIEDAALQLPEDQQLALVEALLANVGSSIDPELKAAWLAEAKRRWADIQAGRTDTVGLADVLLQIESRGNAHRPA